MKIVSLEKHTIQQLLRNHKHNKWLNNLQFWQRAYGQSFGSKLATNREIYVYM